MSTLHTADWRRPATASGRRLAATVLAAALLSPLLAACGSSKHSGFATLSTDGQVMVTSAHGGAHEARTGAALQPGDSVEVVSKAAQISLGGDGAIQLRTGTRLTLGTTINLTQGAILLQPATRHTLRAATDQATLVVPSGAAQVAADTSPEVMVVKVYQGSSQLDVPTTASGPGQSIDVAAPRELLVTPANRPIPVPLQYQESDTWDHQYLSEAERISAQLTAAITGFNAQVPASEGSSASFYQQLVPTLSGHPDFASSFSAAQVLQVPHAANVAAPKPGDYLIAAIIAIRGTRGTLQSRLVSELTFFAQGAPWGFVAYDQGITDLQGVLDDVLAAIARAPLPFSSGSQIAIGPPTATVPATTPPTVPRRTTPRTVTPVRPVTPTTGPTPTPTSPPTTAPPGIQLPVPNVPGPLGQILNPLLDPLIQALNNILAGRI